MMCTSLRLIGPSPNPSLGSRAAMHKYNVKHLWNVWSICSKLASRVCRASFGIERAAIHFSNIAGQPKCKKVWRCSCPMFGLPLKRRTRTKLFAFGFQFQNTNKTHLGQNCLAQLLPRKTKKQTNLTRRYHNNARVCIRLSTPICLWSSVLAIEVGQ